MILTIILYSYSPRHIHLIHSHCVLTADWESGTLENWNGEDSDNLTRWILSKCDLMHNRSSMVAVQGPVLWPTLAYLNATFGDNHANCSKENKIKNAVFWDVAPRKSCVNRRFGGTYRLHLRSRLQPPARAAFSLADYSTLKMEEIGSSETSVHTRSTQRHIPEDGILQDSICFWISSMWLVAGNEYNI
jgi:hypothetical protein